MRGGREPSEKIGRSDKSGDGAGRVRVRVVFFLTFARNFLPAFQRYVHPIATAPAPQPHTGGCVDVTRKKLPGCHSGTATSAGSATLAGRNCRAARLAGQILPTARLAGFHISTFPHVSMRHVGSVQRCTDATLLHRHNSYARADLLKSERHRPPYSWQSGKHVPFSDMFGTPLFLALRPIHPDCPMSLPMGEPA